MSDTVLVMVEGTHMYMCHLQRGTIDDREGTYTVESSNQLEYSHVVHKILTNNDTIYSWLALCMYKLFCPKPGRLPNEVQ